MSYYGFEYFCGANVIVSVNDMPLLEAAGISYQAQDSKMPIYGYSSRHYDAVAQGQVIIQGTLLVNYVHQDYLFRAIELAGGGGGESQYTGEIVPGVNADLTGLVADYAQAQSFITEMKRQYWDNELPDSSFSSVINSYNPFDIAGGVDIVIAFGRSSSAEPAGRTAALLTDVHFTGRSSAIRIDEDVIVEAYDFFARDVFSLRNRPPGLPVNPEAQNPDEVTFSY